MELIIKHFNELSAMEAYLIFRARERVFIGEQKTSYDIDERDTDAYHVLLLDGGDVVGYARVLAAGTAYPEVSMGRILTTRRGNGYGRVIMEAGIKTAREKFGADKIRIGAQSYAKGFYEKMGFKQISEEFLEENIPHIYMIFEF